MNLENTIIASMTKNVQVMTESELHSLNTRVQEEAKLSINELFTAYNNSNITYMNIGKDFNKFIAHLAEAEKEGLLSYYAEDFVEMYYN